MESPLCHSLIITTAEDMRRLRLSCGVDDFNLLKESLEKVVEWCQKQDHLKEASKYLNFTVLERLFLISKGSIESTKQRLDKLLTSRGLMPELLSNRSIDEFDKLCNCVRYVTLPKLCQSDQSRVIATQFLTDKLDDFTLLKYLRYGFMMGEYRTNFDSTISERYILDFTNLTISIISKINPIVIKKAEILCTEVIGVRVKGIHILNAPPFVDKIVSILKQALKEKVANRIQVHRTYDDLHKYIPKEILPKDFGGDEISCSELAKRWKDILNSEEARNIINTSEKLISDEMYRQNLKFNEEYLGMPGSFKQLSVD